MPRAPLTDDRPPRLTPRVEPGAGEGLTLAQVPGLLRRSWIWIVLPTLAAALAALAFVQLATPRYTGEAKILLESREAAFARNAAERNEQSQPIDEQAVASQVQVVMSRDLAREAIRSLGLVGNPEFDPSVAEIGTIQRLLMMAGLARNPLERPPEDRVLAAYFDRLLVYPAGKSRILTVEFRSKDPELAARGANTVAELYIASLEAAKADTAHHASAWLGGNIDVLRSRVAEAEAKVESYRARSGLIAAGGTANQPLGAQQLGELSTQLSQARTAKADLTGRAKLIREMIKDGRLFEIPDVANNDLIRRTVESRINLRAQLALESRTLLPAHPRIKELTAQVGDLEQQIKAAADRIVRTLENDARIAEARVESLQAAVDAQRDVVAKGNASEVQLRALEREAKVQREQLESYLSRYREATARDAESATPADARIVSRAVVPEIPSFPKKLPIIGFASALALLFTAGAVLARHLLIHPDRTGDEAAEAVSAAAPDPSRLDYPEPLPPGSFSPGTLPPDPGRLAPVLAAFENALTGTATFPHPVTAAAAEAPRAEAHAVTREAPEAPQAAPEAPQATAEAPQAAPEAAHDDAAEAAGERGPYDLALLIGRLGETPCGEGGRRVLVVETAGEGAPAHSLATGLAVHLADAPSSGARTLFLDVNGPASAYDDPGLTDLVAGEAAFLDVIHAVPGSRLQAVARGFVDTDVLTEEPQALAISLDAMAQAYDWVVLRLRSDEGDVPRALLSVAAARVDAVVIASDAEADDADLVALYERAGEAGAAQVLVAQNRDVGQVSAEGPDRETMPLRLSA